MSFSDRKTFIVEVANLPVSIDLSPSESTVLIYTFLGISLTFLGISLPIAGFLATLSFLIFIGILLLVRAFFLHHQSHNVTLNKGEVTIATQNLSEGRRVMTIPYNEYQGLQMGQKLVRYGKHDYRVHQTISLAHLKKGLNICLYNQQETDEPRSQWQDYAKLLNVPTIQRDGAGFKKILPHEIDLTLQQRHNQKNIAKVTQEDQLLPIKETLLKDAPQKYASNHNLPKISNLPKSLGVIQPQTPYEETLKIQIKSNRVTFTAKSTLLAFGLGLALHPFYIESYPLMVFLGIIMLLWFLRVVTADLMNLRVLSLNNREIKFHDSWSLSHTSRTLRNLDFDDIETILIQGPEYFASSLVISSKEGEINLGRGLDTPTLTWLQNYLREAVVTA